MDARGALRRETAQLVADYLESCGRPEGPRERPAPSPAAATLRLVARELRRRYRDFFECARSRLLEQAPEQVLAEVAELVSRDGFNWGRAAVLVVFAGSLLELDEPRKERRAPRPRGDLRRRLARELCRYLVEQQGAWLQEHGGWTGFHHHFTQNQQSDPSSTLCCIMAAAAGFGLVGLALLLAVR